MIVTLTRFANTLRIWMRLARCEVLKLKHRAAAALLLLLVVSDRIDHCTNGLIEHVLQSLLSESTALHVLDSIDLLCLLHALLVRDRCHALLLQSLNRLRIVTKIELRAGEDDRGRRAVVRHFGVPLRAHVLERRRRDDREANQEHIRLRVGKRAQTIVIFLSGSIPKTKVDRLAVNHHVRRVVVKDGGDVLSGERVPAREKTKTRSASEAARQEIIFTHVV